MQKQSPLDNLVFVITLLLVFIMAARTPLDSDMWWHLKAGEITLSQGSPLLIDMFSFTRYGNVWINHSWLGQVLLYLLFDGGGFWGLGFGVALTVCATFAIVYRSMEGASMMRAAIVILAATVSSFVWSPRPQIFSMLLFAFLLFGLYQYQRGNSTRLWWLAPVFILWSNLHGGYSLGFLLLAAFLAGMVVDVLLDNQENATSIKNEIIQILLWSGISLLAILFNPNGFGTWRIPFQTVGVETLQNLIDEWSSPNFHDLAMQPFLWLMFLTFFSLALTKNKISGFELIGTIGFAYLALVAKRNFAPFALFAAVVLSQHLPSALEKFTSGFVAWLQKKRFSPVSQKPLPERIRRAINLFLAASLAVVGLVKLFSVTHPVVVHSYEARYYPVEAVRLLQTGKTSGNLFNSYGWGGYLIWNLPGTRVFADGRTDLFGDEILADWITIIQAQPGWEENLEQWKVDHVLIEPQQPLAKALVNAGWRQVYRDEVSVLLER